ncbi:hypothetical protein BC828DRAFT_380876 [Blastocladiella britannica]|nr:hypothetical protein BC828DRAFT_380876 [Blastocladiella britannica]
MTMDLLEIDHSVDLRDLSTRKVLASSSFFASVLNLLVLRGQYRLPEVRSVSETQLPTLVHDFLVAAADHFPEVDGYSIGHARSFLVEYSTKAISLNPHCNQPGSFDPSPAIDFLAFLGVPVFHGLLADPSESFQLRGMLENLATWKNVSAAVDSNPDVGALINQLRVAPCGMTPAFSAALASLPDKFDFAMYFNAARADWSVLAHAPRNPREPLVFHAAAVDCDGYVAYEKITSAAAVAAAAASVSANGTGGEGGALADPNNATKLVRQFTDEAFNGLPVHDIDGALFVDLSFREQSDKDFAIALAMEDEAAFEAIRERAGYQPIYTSIAMGASSGEMGGGGTSYIPPPSVLRKHKSKSKSDVHDGKDVGKKKGGGFFKGLFGKNKKETGAAVVAEKAA